jgi:SAM-dependent methyltransferase
MHATSLENMRRCLERHGPIDGAARARPLVVLDLGGADVNGSYRELFPPPRFAYRVADIADSPSVDVRLADPYRIPLADGSVDVLVSGQMLEHCEFFWLTFAEMVRVLASDGVVFLIAPSGGPIHRYPVDCYRFYPDAFAALAKLTSSACSASRSARGASGRAWSSAPATRARARRPPRSLPRA